MSETPSAERHSRAKAIYGLAVFLLVTAHGLVLFLSWLIKAVRPDWPLRPLLSEEGCAGSSAISRTTSSRRCSSGCYWASAPSPRSVAAICQEPSAD